MEHVHGQGQRFMGFLGNGTVGHGAGLEMTDDAVHALHFLDGDRLSRIIEVQKASQVSAGLLIHHAGVFLKGLIISFPGRLLQKVNRLRIVTVSLAAASHLVLAYAVQRQIGVQSQGIKSLAVALVHILCDILQGNSAHAAHSSGEIFLDNILGNTDGLEDLGTLIRLDRGNTHLGSDFYNAA